jgi:hypothetical protein
MLLVIATSRAPSCIALSVVCAVLFLKQTRRKPLEDL